MELLKTKNEIVLTKTGKYLFSIAMTNRALEILNEEDWEKGVESWLAYRQRTEQERIKEEIKRRQLATDLVNAYNKFITNK